MKLLEVINNTYILIFNKNKELIFIKKEHYLSIKDAIFEQLNNIREQDEQKYRLVLANIMFVKAYLKHAGVYKLSKEILEGDKQLEGIGVVKFGNWILQNGGNFIDAAKDF